MKNFYVYILCNKRNGTLYTGVTSKIIKRIYEHKNKLVDGFTKKYNLHRLVWYELHETVESAITREKRIKKWERKWKLELIEKDNPRWNDLYDHICENSGFPINRPAYRQAGLGNDDAKPCGVCRTCTHSKPGIPLM